MKTRTDILNHLAAAYGLQRYLEIGVQNPMQNFDKIICPYKVSVDPEPRASATFSMTSDEFFENEPEKFDLIFIDGLHHSWQVLKDFMNAVGRLNAGGFIVLHDCNPQKEEHTIVPRQTASGHWNGDCYKVAAKIPFPKVTVDEDNGCCVVRLFDGKAAPSIAIALAAAGVAAITAMFVNLQKGNVPLMSWQEFDANRKELLNLITWDEFERQYHGSYFQ